MTEQQQEAKALVRTAPTDADIEGIRRAGKQISAYQKEVNALYKTISGLEWGSGNRVVTGASLSPATRYAFAEFCRIVRANPMTQVDLLGGKPYLNADYWADLINSQDHFHHYTQRDLSPSVEFELRDQAGKEQARAEKLDGEEASKRLAVAFDLEDQANAIARARKEWSPRDTATCVIETTIHRFINAAPIEAIRRGEITDFEPYLTTVTECNWAGGMKSTMADAKKYDPIGDANPGTTARTRSLRRAATKAFSAWMTPYEAQLKKASETIEAEWELVQEDKAVEQAALPAPNGPQAVSTSNGEPTAANPKDAIDLPTEEPPFDKVDAHKRLFATWHELNMSGEAERKAWSTKNGFPASTKLWSEADYVRAQDLLVSPIRKKVEAGIAALGKNLADVSLALLGKEVPDYMRDWVKLDAAVTEMANAPQESLI